MIVSIAFEVINFQNTKIYLGKNRLSFISITAIAVENGFEDPVSNPRRM